MKREDDVVCAQAFSDLLDQKEAEITKLRKTIEEKNEDLFKAGDLGRGLLEQNSHLEEMLENIQKDHSKMVEEYEQESYSLKNRLEVLQKTKDQAVQNLEEEVNRSKMALKLADEANKKKHADEVARMQKKIDDARAELHEEKRQRTNCSQTLDLKEKQVQSLQTELKQLQSNMNDTMSGEVAELTNENCNLKLLLQEMESDLHEQAQKIDQLKDMYEIAKANAENMKQAKEEIQQEAEVTYTALENTRGECCQLQAELDSLRLQPSDPNSRGNSLFAEVEDKRIAAEKRLISMNAHYKCMTAQNEQLKHYILKLKMQMSALLETRSRASDTERFRSLEDALSASRNDNSKLLLKMKELQEKLSKQRLDDNMTTGQPQSDTSAAVVKFFKNELKERNNENKRLTEELRLSEMYLLSEEKKVSSLKAEIYEINRQMAAANSLSFKQQIEIDRLKMKCGEDMKMNAQPRKWKREKIRKDSEEEATRHVSDEKAKEKENDCEGQGPLLHKSDPNSGLDRTNPESISDMDKQAEGEMSTRVPLSEKLNSNANATSEPEVKVKEEPSDVDILPKTDPAQSQERKSAFVKCNDRTQTARVNHATTVADCKQQ